MYTCVNQKCTCTDGHNRTPLHPVANMVTTTSTCTCENVEYCGFGHNTGYQNTFRTTAHGWGTYLHVYTSTIVMATRNGYLSVFGTWHNSSRKTIDQRKVSVILNTQRHTTSHTHTHTSHTHITHTHHTHTQQLTIHVQIYVLCIACTYYSIEV